MRVRVSMSKAEQLRIIDEFTQLRNGKPVHIGRHIRKQRIKDAQREIDENQRRHAAAVAAEKLRQDKLAEVGQAEFEAAMAEATPDEQTWARGAVERVSREFVLDHLRRNRRRREARRQIHEANARGVIEFAHVTPHRTSYAIVVPDASEPGKWRASFFDERGFSGHVTYETPGQVLNHLAQEGYLGEANGTLERLSATQEWAEGMAHVHLNQLLPPVRSATDAAIHREVHAHLERHKDAALTLSIVQKHLGDIQRHHVPLDLMKAEWARWHGGTEPPAVLATAIQRGLCDTEHVDDVRPAESA